MIKETTYPFKELESYALSSWIEDLICIIKARGFLMKKEDAFRVFVENAAEFMELYCESYTPMQAFVEFQGEE